MMKEIGRILSVAALAVLLLSICIVGRTLTVGAEGVVVRINAPLEVVKGNTFTASVDIASVTAFDAGQFDVSFDESLIQLDNVSAGLIGTTQVPVDLWNKMGTGVYRIVVNVPGIPGVSGSGSLAVLQFHAASSAVGTSTISVSNGFINNNLGVEITAVWNGDSVGVCEDLTMSTVSLAGGVVGNGYSAVLEATGGSGSYAWSVSSGSLPDGLSLSTAGNISGVPNSAGESSFTVTVTDGVLAVSRSFTIKIALRAGDADGDGAVSVADITKVERIIATLDGTTSGADVNLDGKINTADITRIERIIAGLA